MMSFKFERKSEPIAHRLKNTSFTLEDLYLKTIDEVLEKIAELLKKEGYDVTEDFVSERCTIVKVPDKSAKLYVDNELKFEWSEKVETEDDTGIINLSFLLETKEKE